MAALVGSIYYWDISRTRIVRIDDGTTNRTEIMPTPPTGVDGNNGRSGSAEHRNGTAHDFAARQMVGVGRQVAERHVPNAVGLSISDAAGGRAGLER